MFTSILHMVESTKGELARHVTPLTLKSSKTNLLSLRDALSTYLPSDTDLLFETFETFL